MLGQERGFALVIALAVTFVFSMTVVTVIEAATSNSRSSDRSKGQGLGLQPRRGRHQQRRLDPLQEQLLRPSPPAPAGDVRAGRLREPAGESRPAQRLLGNTCSPYSWTYDGGTTTMWGWFDSTTSNWTITSTGSVRNAFGGAATTRTLTASVHVHAAPSQDNYVTAWNYVFVKDTTPNVCNMQLDQTTNFSVSLYVEGNLCFKNGAYIAETDPTDPISLEIRNKIVWLSGSQKGVGNTGLAEQRASQHREGRQRLRARPSTGAGHTCCPAGRLLLRQVGWLHRPRLPRSAHRS